MPSSAMTSFTEAASMPRSRKSREAACTAAVRVRAVSSRDRRMLCSRVVEPELFAERTIENACWQIPAQPPQEACAAARRVTQARLFGSRGFQHRLRHHLRFVASAQRGAHLCARAIEGGRVVGDQGGRGRSVALELRARVPRLDERNADTERTG